MIRVTGSESVTLEISGMPFILNNFPKQGAIVDMTLSRKEAQSLLFELEKCLSAKIPARGEYLHYDVPPNFPLSKKGPMIPPSASLVDIE